MSDTKKRDKASPLPNDPLGSYRPPTEFVWFIIFVGGLAFLVFNLFWVFPTIGDLESTAREKQQEAALRIASRMDAFVDGRTEDLASAASALAPLKALLPVEEKEFLFQHLNSHLSVIDLTLIADDGREEYFISRSEESPASHLSDRSTAPEFMGAKETGRYVGQWSRRGISPYPVLTIASAVNNNGTFLGVLSATVSLQLLRQLTTQIHPDGSGYVYIADHEGTIVVHPENKQGKSPISMAAIDKALAGTPAVFEEYVNESRVKMYAVIVPLPDTGWVTVVEEPASDLFLARDRLRIVAISGVVLGFAVLLIITWYSFTLLGATRLLNRQRMQTEAIIRYLTDGLIQYDHGSRILIINPVAEQLLGVSRSEVLGRHIHPADIHNPKLEALVQVMFPALAHEAKRLTKDPNEYPKIHDLTLKKPADRNFQLSTVPILDERGVASSFVKVVHDVTREKLIQRTKSEFISIAAHQLRTPLSGIKWTIKLLLDGDLGPINDKQRNFLEKGYEVNERMIGLIRDLLDVARLEEGRFGFEFGEHDLGNLCAGIIEEYQTMFHQKGVVLQHIVSSEPIPKITMDPGKIRLVLANLLENALKYTPKGKVTVALNRDGKFMQIRVHDTGVGIPKNQKLQIFSRFFRASNVIRLQTEGSGLGLFIVRNIVRRHGGEVWFDSEEGKGTTFVFTLPIDRELIPRGEQSMAE